MRRSLLPTVKVFVSWWASEQHGGLGRYFRGMKPTILLCTGACLLLLSGCGDGKADAAKKIATVADSIKASSTIDLGQYHMPLAIQMPVGLPVPTIAWKDEAGKLSVKSGDHFALEIFEAPADMDRLKADLERDLLKKNTIIQESPELLIYRSEFPDDSTLVFFHFHQLINAGDRSFVLVDAADGTAFTHEDVLRMCGAVRAKSPA